MLIYAEMNCSLWMIGFERQQQQQLQQTQPWQHQISAIEKQSKAVESKVKNLNQ